MTDIEVVTMAGDTWTIPVADRTVCNLDALRRAACDHGFRAHLAETLWDPDRDIPTSEAQIGGYIWEIADRLATALEGALLACPPGWECVCGALNHGSWSSPTTCRGCRIEAAKPSQVSAHFRMVPPPAENGLLAKRMEAARARAAAREQEDAAIARVRVLHQPEQPPEGHQWLSGGRAPKCKGCDHEGNPFTAPDWPCDTIRALDGQEPVS